MKTKLTILGLVLMVSLVTISLAMAMGLGVNKNVSLDTTYKDKIDSINNELIERGDITCDNLGGTLTGSERCTQRMWKGDYQLGSVSVGATKCGTYNETLNELNKTSGECLLWVALKDDKIIEEVSKQQEKKLEEIAKVIIKRGEKSADKNIEDSGTVTLIEKHKLF